MFLVSMMDAEGRAAYVAHPGGRATPGPESVAAGAGLRLTQKRRKAFAFKSIDACRGFLAWLRAAQDPSGRSDLVPLIETIPSHVTPDVLPESFSDETEPVTHNPKQGKPTMSLTTKTQEILQGVTLDDVAEVLRDNGFTCLRHDNSLESAASGLKFAIFLAGNPDKASRASAVQFFVGLRMNEDPAALLKKVNKWNAEKRFPKLFIDQDGDLCGVMEVLTTGITTDTLEHALKLWSVAVGQIFELA